MIQTLPDIHYRVLVTYKQRSVDFEMTSNELVEFPACTKTTDCVAVNVASDQVRLRDTQAIILHAEVTERP